MATLGIARRVPLAITGAWRRFAQDPARGRAALERALPGLAAGAGEDPLGRFDYAVARDRLDDARAALDEISVDDPARESCALAVDVLAGSLTAPSLTRPRDARGRRAVRAARRQLATLAMPIASGDHLRSGGPGRETARESSLGVLHVVTNSLPVTQAGSTIRTQRVARAQRDVGWDARVVTRPGYPVTHGDLRSANPQMLDGVPYHRLLPLVMPSDNGMRAAYVRLLDALVDDVRPDVLHAASDHVNAAVALEVGRRRGLPVAYEARTFFEDTWLARHGGEAARGSEVYQMLRQRHTEALLGADVVTTLGQGMRDEIIRRGVDPARVFITPNAVPLDFLVPRDRSPHRAPLGLSEAFIVGSVATVNDDEGLDTLVDAVSLLRVGGLDARVVIVGDGPALPRLRAQAEAAGVPILTPGRVPVEDVREWYDVLDVFALPRRDTAVNRAVTALKPLEAQARGIPVVGSDLPAVAEVLAPESMLTPAGDASALATSLSALVDPHMRAQAGERARAWVATHRTWPSVMESYRAAYSFLGALRG